MKILLTGATGFLGSHMLRYFLNKGHEMIILKRSTSDTWRVSDLLNKVKCYDIDSGELERVFKENPKLDVILHTAVSYGKKSSFSDLLITNIYFPMRLLEYALQYKVRCFCYSDTKLDKFTSSYSLSKLQFAEWGKYVADNNKIAFIDTRIEHMYGDMDDDNKFIPWVIKNCRDNVPYINLTLGEQKRDFIHVDDVVSAYDMIIKENKISGYEKYEIGTGKTKTIRQLVENIKEVIGTSTELRFGQIDYRKNETMESKANIEALVKLGWHAKMSIDDMISSL